ncbi:MAG: hypothetical protein KDJ65_34005 [Anaerolineae bacterium]|nr:hypothetical protein [Anaerolineae bacterium]
MSKSNWLPLIIGGAVLIVLAFIGGRMLYFGSGTGTYTPPERELLPANIEAAAVPPKLEAADNPEVSRGAVVVDYSHENALYIEELNVLLSKVVSRGFSYEVVTPEEAEVVSLVDRLSYAKALVLPLPRIDYTPEEITAIEQYVDRGGRVLIIGDPTRTIVVESLNSIAGSFGIIYANDYLYSLESNDNNYRNVVYTNFNDSVITDGIGDNDKVIFYASGSVSAPGHEIIMGDDTVFSSTSESSGAKASAALTTNDQVLALGDLTFFTQPHDMTESNGILINNIANFLTSGNRTFELRDFPYFLNTEVNIVFDDTKVFNSQFEDAVKLKEYLEATERTVEFTDEIGDSRDIIYISRFDKADAVQDYLDEANIVLLEPEDVEEEVAEESGSALTLSTVSSLEGEEGDEEKFVQGRIQIEGVGELEQGGATLFYLHQEEDQNVLIILSNDAETNADAFGLLFDNKINECVVNATIAVCQTVDPEQRLAPSVRSNRIDKILVVSDNDGRARESGQTSLVQYTEVLSAAYSVEDWVTSTDGSPELAELQEYDAVIWTTGDYWDDSISEADMETLQQYITAGGNLVLSGSSIAFDWDHTDFMPNILHADYLTVGEQTDIEVSMSEHPLAKDFEPGAVFTFTESLSEENSDIDVVNYTSDARVIFRRGPDSEYDGAPTVIAYEDDRSKIAYFAFPLYRLQSGPRAVLIDNAIDWFTRSPLDLPAEIDYQPFEIDDSGGGSGDEAPPEDGGEGEEAPPEDGGEGDEGDTGDEGGEGEDSPPEDGDEGDGGDNGDEGSDDGSDDGGEGGEEGESGP